MGRKCVAELVADIPERIYPVGRLDRDSEGMLLMTNDGDFGKRYDASSSMHIPNKLLRYVLPLRKTKQR